MSNDPYQLYLHSLEAKRAPAMARAAQLLAEDRYDEAEAEVTRADDSIYGAVAIGRLYTERLRAFVEAGFRRGPRTEEIFRRALRWRSSAYPEPHTECEAERYDAGRDADRAELVKILGWDPARSERP